MVISHDDRYYGIADRVVKLESGRIEYAGQTMVPVSVPNGPVTVAPSWP
jgi:putative ATP-binding cassette transporter